MTGYRVYTAVFLACCLLGCSDNGPIPGQTGDGLGNFEGIVDPSSGSVVLKTLDVPTEEGVPVRVELIGRFAGAIDLPGRVSIYVSVRNADRRTLHSPASIVIGGFTPHNVYPASGNADWIRCPLDTHQDSSRVFPGSCSYGYDYSDLLGDDDVLSPGETSGERLWIFVNPDMVSFSFQAAARFALEPGRARIGGTFFWDHNRNGVQDANEAPVSGGLVEISGPGEPRRVLVGERGHYSFHIEEAGLYSLWATPPPTFAPVEFTTPNPLEVVILWQSTGVPQSFLEANFGIANVFGGGYPLVRFAESSAGLRLDQYSLLDIALDGRILKLRAGFSGCSDDQPFQLYMVGDFMESNPVQARLLLDHNDRDELCDAYWVRELGYDLGPIIDSYARRYGGPGKVILRFEDWHGDPHFFELGP